MYIPTRFIKQYIEEHGKFSLTEEEFNKALELIHVIFISGYQVCPIEKTSEKNTNLRKEICKSCDKYEMAGDVPSCKLCGCNLNKKTKLALESCPIAKWSLDMDILREAISKSVEFLNSKIDDGLYNGYTFEDKLEKNIQKYSHE